MSLESRCSNEEPICIKCGGKVTLVEGSTLEAIGYGYGTFECLKCGHQSSYYGEDLIFPSKPTEPKGKEGE